LNRYSPVSSAVRRVKTKLQKDREFKARLEPNENSSLTGQTKTPVRDFAPNWNDGMLEYWKNGSWNTAILGKRSAEGRTNIKFKMNNIL